MSVVRRLHCIKFFEIGLAYTAIVNMLPYRICMSFLSKLLSNTEDNMSSRIFTTMEMDDVYSITIVQQCKMLEAPTCIHTQLKTDVKSENEETLRPPKYETEIQVERPFLNVVGIRTVVPKTQQVCRFHSHTEG